MHARLAAARNELPRAVRIAVAAVLAWWIARLLGADRPVFAVIVPMVAIRDDTHAALSLSLGRMLGVMAGVVLGIGVVAVAGVSTTAIVLLLVAGLAIGLFLRTGPELNTQIAISALLVLIVTEDADSYAVERIWETGVGSVVALARRGVRAAARSARPTAAPARRDGARRSRRDLAAAQGTLARGDPSARALLTRADDHARAAGRAVEDLPKAQRALRLSPLRRGSRAQLEVVDRRQRLALRLAIQVRRLARDLASFAHRDDLRDEWDEAARRLPPIIAAISAAAAKALAGEGCSREVAEARELIAGLPARGQPPGRRDPAAAARPARPTSSRGRRHERRRARRARTPRSTRCGCSRAGSASATTCACSRPGRRCRAIAPGDAARALGRRRPAAALLAAARARRDGERGQDDDRAPRRGDAARERHRGADRRRRARRQRLADGRARRARPRRRGRRPGAWRS